MVRTTLFIFIIGVIQATGAVASAAAEQPAMDGAPADAEVRFESRFSIPAAGYALVCPDGVTGCTVQGAVDLATRAEVPVTYDERVAATHGVAELPFTLVQGTASMTYGCEGAGSPWLSQITADGTIAGELEIAGVKAVPGTNTLAVALNHGGDSGNEFPQETYDRSDGGCDTPVQEFSPTMGQWYYHFYLAHRGEQQDISNDLELQGLAYEGGAFTKTFNRGVNVPGRPGYIVEESTRIEVEPRWCRGRQNRIVSATAGGESLGLDGARLYPGQVITAPADARIRLGDGSSIELKKGGRFHVERCAENLTEVYLGETVSDFLVRVRKAAAGSRTKFEVRTERAVVGVRGTVFSVSYSERRQRTRVAVREGSVSLRGTGGARGRVIVRAGQVGVQSGRKAPRVVRR